MQGITYDPSRKLGPIQICTTPKTDTTDAVYKQYSPVPYNLDFELNIISKNNNDSVSIGTILHTSNQCLTSVLNWLNKQKR